MGISDVLVRVSSRETRKPTVDKYMYLERLGEHALSIHYYSEPANLDININLHVIHAIYVIQNCTYRMKLCQT